MAVPGDIRVVNREKAIMCGVFMAAQEIRKCSC